MHLINYVINFFIKGLNKFSFPIIFVANKLLKRPFYKSKINIVIRKKNGNILKKAGKRFSRQGHTFDPIYLIEREKMFLKILDGCISPKLKKSGEGWIEMEYSGQLITKQNLPSDWEAQINKIASVLSEFRIIHRDIKSENILVKDRKIVLIDFSWSVFENEDYYLTPRELTNIDDKLIYDNFYALNFFINSLR